MPTHPCSKHTQRGRSKSVWAALSPGVLLCGNSGCVQNGCSLRRSQSTKPNGESCPQLLSVLLSLRVVGEEKSFTAGTTQRTRRAPWRAAGCARNQHLALFSAPTEPSAELRSPGAPGFEAAQRLTASLWHFLMSSSFRASRLRAEQGAAQRGAGSPRRDGTGEGSRHSPAVRGLRAALPGRRLQPVAARHGLGAPRGGGPLVHRRGAAGTAREPRPAAARRPSLRRRKAASGGQKGAALGRGCRSAPRGRGDLLRAARSSAVTFRARLAARGRPGRVEGRPPSPVPGERPLPRASVPLPPRVPNPGPGPQPLPARRPRAARRRHASRLHADRSFVARRLAPPPPRAPIGG